MSVLAFAACTPATRPAAPPPAPVNLPQTVGAAPISTRTAVAAQPVAPTPPQVFDQYTLQQLNKRFTDLSFFTQLTGEMVVKKIIYSGADKLPIPAYFFAPRDTLRKHAALIIVHDGIHSDFNDRYIPHVRSLVKEGYVIVAPEYRGSTGYGQNFFDLIDYGGKEVDDVLAARAYLRALVPYADLDHLGIIGWSHGGFITLLSIFRNPEYFKVAVAHVPVADLPARMRTHSADYQKIFSVQPGYGGTLLERPLPYVQRSPVAHARELRTPLLVHTASNDDDVFIIENHNLRDSMIVAGKMRAGLFTYREWQDPPGGHEFNRMQTPEAKESWDETLAFLRRYLRPVPMPNVTQSAKPTPSVSQPAKPHRLPDIINKRRRTARPADRPSAVRR